MRFSIIITQTKHSHQQAAPSRERFVSYGSEGLTQPSAKPHAFTRKNPKCHVARFSLARIMLCGRIRRCARVTEWQTCRSQKPMWKHVWVRIPPRVPLAFESPLYEGLFHFPQKTGGRFGTGYDPRPKPKPAPIEKKRPYWDAFQNLMSGNPTGRNRPRR